jgi:hypothetical protein
LVTDTTRATATQTAPHSYCRRHGKIIDGGDGGGGGARALQQLAAVTVGPERAAAADAAGESGDELRSHMSVTSGCCSDVNGVVVAVCARCVVIIVAIIMDDYDCDKFNRHHHNYFAMNQHQYHLITCMPPSSVGNGPACHSNSKWRSPSYSRKT